MADTAPSPPALEPALRLFREGRLDEAREACLAVARAHPDHPGPLRLLARVLVAQRAEGPALRALRLARRIAPRDRDVATDLGILLIHRGEAREAVTVLAEVAPLDARSATALGVALRLVGRAEEAVSVLAAAGRLAPGDAGPRAELASTLEELGRLEEADAAAREALALDPELVAPALVRVTVARLQGRLEEAAAMAEDLADRAPSEEARGEALVELALCLDRLGRPAEAFEAMRAGQAGMALAPEARRQDPEHFPALVARLRNWTARHLDRPARPPCGTRSLAFLVGFPRSGTTLLHQVLDAHPAVVSLDEREVLADLLRAMPEVLGRAVPYPDGLDTLAPAELDRLRAAWWRLAERHLGEPVGKRLLLDKLPLNLVHVPFIRLLFPESPVLVLIRDPRDCVLSNFFQPFEPTVAMVHMDSPEGAARLYAQVMEGWLLARRLPGLRYHELRYEDLVDNPRAVLAPVLAHLGLPWDDAVLRHDVHARGHAIRTPSRHEVRKPIHRGAVGRWRRYAAELAPVLPVLRPYLRAFGYPEQ